MDLNLIVAMTNDYVIGLDNKLPWHIADDMKNFKELTMGNTVIMGRNTYESIPEKFRPLPNRNNIVVSSKMKQNDYKGITVVSTLDEALETSKNFSGKPFIIGGAQLYESAMPLMDNMYISLVHGNYQGNVHFPKIDVSMWDVSILKSFPDFNLMLYTRKNNFT